MHVVLILSLLCFVCIIIRAFVVQVMLPYEDKLTKIAESQYYHKLTLSKDRGFIYDRRQLPLAISVKKPSLFINPRVFAPSNYELEQLAHILDISKSSIINVKNKHSYFSWLKRKITHVQLQKIQSLNIKGLFYIMEPSRFYPLSESASNLLGVVGEDNVGLLGIERQYDKALSEPPQVITLFKDAKGKFVFFESQKAQPLGTGNNLYLTIDKVIQDFNYLLLSFV